MSDGTAFPAAGVRLKKMRGSGLRCVITKHTDNQFFLSRPENLRELRVLLEELTIFGRGQFYRYRGTELAYTRKTSHTSATNSDTAGHTSKVATAIPDSMGKQNKTDFIHDKEALSGNTDLPHYMRSGNLKNGSTRY